MLSPDTILQNRYRIVRKLSAGGMGTVYETIDLRFNSQVALKETHFTEEALRKQFEREARLLNRLRHPALARVIDHFTEGDGQYLVMDYIEGNDLFEMLQKRHEPFPVEDVLKWADQLLDALDYLHSQEPPVIHRDIKPQNIKLTSRNQIILLDFGLAKGFAGQISRVTTSGSIFGYTPNYAPLEQIHGEGTDPRSDLYSFAAALYNLLTRTTPPDALKRVTVVTDGDPDPLRPVHQINSQVPVALSDVIQKGMAISRKNRFPSASEMREALLKAKQPINTIVDGKDSAEALLPTMLDHTPAQRSQDPPSTALTPIPMHESKEDVDKRETEEAMNRAAKERERKEEEEKQQRRDSRRKADEEERRKALEKQQVELEGKRLRERVRRQEEETKRKRAIEEAAARKRTEEEARRRAEEESQRRAKEQPSITTAKIKESPSSTLFAQPEEKSSRAPVVIVGILVLLPIVVMIGLMAFASSTTENTNATSVPNTNVTPTNTPTVEVLLFKPDLTRQEFERRKEEYAREARMMGANIDSGADDLWLWAKLRGQLTARDELRGAIINVDVENSVITLRGTVSRREQVQIADAMAKSIEGAKGIRNLIRVSGP